MGRPKRSKNLSLGGFLFRLSKSSFFFKVKVVCNQGQLKEKSDVILSSYHLFIDEYLDISLLLPEHNYSVNGPLRCLRSTADCSKFFTSVVLFIINVLLLILIDDRTHCINYHAFRELFTIASMQQNILKQML
jgi:hypothetical protein